MANDSDGRLLGRGLRFASLVIVVLMNLCAYALVAAPGDFRQVLGGAPGAVLFLTFFAYVVLGPGVLVLWLLWDKNKDVRRRALDRVLLILVVGGISCSLIMLFFE